MTLQHTFSGISCWSKRYTVREKIPNDETIKQTPIPMHALQHTMKCTQCNTCAWYMLYCPYKQDRFHFRLLFLSVPRIFQTSRAVKSPKYNGRGRSIQKRVKLKGKKWSFWDVVGLPCLYVIPSWRGVNTFYVWPGFNTSYSKQFSDCYILLTSTAEDCDLFNLTANPNAVLLFPESDNTRKIKYHHISEAKANVTFIPSLLEYLVIPLRSRQTSQFSLANFVSKCQEGKHCLG